MAKILINLEKCTSCSICILNCPTGSLDYERKKLRVEDKTCVACQACIKVCDFAALDLSLENRYQEMTCYHCPVKCRVPEGEWGACKMYQNQGGGIVRTAEYVLPESPYPLITGIGAGSTYPDYLPAPLILEDTVDGVEVVSAVTEAPLSYASLLLKIDTNDFLGREKEPVYFQDREIGHVTTELYGSKMLSLGGINIVESGAAGFYAVRAMCDLMNGKRVRMKVGAEGIVLHLQVGKEPVVQGRKAPRTRAGCGSAVVGMFAQELKAVVDEAVVVDPQITGLLSEHYAGRYLGIPPLGLKLAFFKSTDGRYFGRHGRGVGGTDLEDFFDIIVGVEEPEKKAGAKVLFLDTAGQEYCYAELRGDGQFQKLPLPPGVEEVIQLIRRTSEPTLVSALLSSGVGGSMRKGIVREPVKLTEGCRGGQVKVSVAGRPAFVLPGGGINILVDVTGLHPGWATWVPTPALVAPVEFTMPKELYLKMGGYADRLIPRQEFLERHAESIRRWPGNGPGGAVFPGHQGQAQGKGGSRPGRAG